MQYTKTQAFSIVLALGLMLLLSFTGLYLLEYMVPFSRNVKGIENASKAFYQGYSAIEEASMNTYSGAQNTKGYEPSAQSFSTTPIGKQYAVTSSGTTIPLAGRGNSEFDADWNQFSLTQPVSLFVGNNLFNQANKKLSFKVRTPSINGVTLKNDDKIILWQLSSENDSLSAKDLLDIPTNNLNLFSQKGYRLNSLTTEINFKDFYISSCGAGSGCVLKLSVVQPLIKTGGGTVPYLEYQISSDRVLPFQESYISAAGKSYGFTKKLEVVLPHRTTSSAFDFTVLQ